MPDPTPLTTPSVLFVCIHNAGRSQMAAAFPTHLANGRAKVRSAGSTPAGSINPTVVQAMREVGIDISTEIPQALTTDAIHTSDVVITMGCGDACPIFPGKCYLDWQLPDPANQNIHKVRSIRDEIERRIRNLLTDLLPTSNESRPISQNDQLLKESLHE